MDNYKRREFIKLSALGFVGIALSLNPITTYAQQANAYLGKWDAKTPLNWDAFLERLSFLAKSQHDLPWNQKRYTKQVKRLLRQCNFPEFENVKLAFESYENKRENWFEYDELHKEVDYQVSLFQFEKGEYIPHHDHPNMTGVLNVVSGDLLARNFDFVEELAETREVTYETGYKATLQKCVLMEVENEVLKEGDIGILTADEGNIHSIMPNEFTQMVDVFTPAYNEETKAKWFQVIEEEFYNGQKNRYEAEYVISL
jgi:cysteamine dioxygenase